MNNLKDVKNKINQIKNDPVANEAAESVFWLNYGVPIAIINAVLSVLASLLKLLQNMK